MAKRIEYIDIAKGIGILLVVMGHNDFALVSPFFYKLIYAFHMPLFFFLSGMFFNTTSSFLRLLRSRYESIIKPFIATLLIIFIMTISFTKVGLEPATTRLIKALYANGHYLDWAQLWFLPHLFALNIFSYLFYRIAKPGWKIWYRLVVLAILFIVGYLSITKFWPFSISFLGRTLTLYGLPLSIDLILVSGLFFVLGREVNQDNFERVLANPVTLLGSSLALILCVIIFPYTLDLDQRMFQSMPINTMEALLGIVVVLCLSIQIVKIPALSKVFQYIGMSSLIILLFHVPIEEAWGEKILYYLNNQAVAYWLAFTAGVIFPILINVYVIQPNPIVRSWFGQPKIESTKFIQNTQDTISTPANDLPDK